MLFFEHYYKKREYKKRDLNYTPASYESLRLSGAVRPCCGVAATLAEQPARGSLVQAQTRSRLVICAVALCESCDAVAANLSFAPPYLLHMVSPFHL